MEYEKSFTDGLQFLWGEGFLSPGGPEEIAVILRTDLAGLRVLDIGSGLGGIDCLLASRFGAAEVIGIDIEPQLVEAASELARRKGLSDRVRFETVAPGPLCFPDASFDTVFSKDAMVHVVDKLGLYREILRILRPGGTFRGGDWFWAAGAEHHPAVMEWLGAGPLHFAFTTVDEARQALWDSGLTEVEVTDRRAELESANRDLVTRLDGPDYQQLVDTVGEASAQQRKISTSRRQAALEAGQLIPCHIFARKA